MKCSLLILLSFLIACLPKVNHQARVTPKAEPGKVLFVCTNVDEVNGIKNGTFLSEIAVPFMLLHEENLDIDIVSPQGGSIPIYYKFDTTAVMRRALASPYYTDKVAHTLKPAEVTTAEYKAVILPGGYGQFWDIHEDKAINQLISNIYEQGGIIGALGHGTSSLVNVNLSNGSPLVQGKTMTCFPSWFEKEFMLEADHGKLLPFDMEEELIKKGAHLKTVDRARTFKGAVVDKEHRLITASMASGGVFIAQEILKLLRD